LHEEAEFRYVDIETGVVGDIDLHVVLIDIVGDTDNEYRCPELSF